MVRSREITMNYKALQQQNQEMRIPIEHAEFIMAFRYRMTKIAYLTRLYIVQNFAKIGNINQVINELYKMPELFRQLGESITGKPVPDEIVNLLFKYDHRLQDLVDAMLSGDSAKADESIKALYELANEIASGLAAYNPNWNKETLEGFLLDYFEYVVAEVIAVESGDYNKALDIFDEMVYKSVDLGDYYAEGFLRMAGEPHQEGTISLGELNIIKDMKLVATQLTYLTRFYMVARITNIYESQYVAQRLYQLPLNLYEKLKMILGYLNSKDLLNLLSIYSIKLEAIIDAIISNDTAAIETSMNDLYQFSDQLADYLAATNPFWSKEKWKELFYSYNNHLIDEATALKTEGTGLTEEPQASLRIFEEMLQAAWSMGDYLAEGLIQYVTTSETPPRLREPWELYPSLIPEV